MRLSSMGLLFRKNGWGFYMQNTRLDGLLFGRTERTGAVSFGFIGVFGVARPGIFQSPAEATGL